MVEVWESCRSRLKERLTAAEFNTWILPLHALQSSSKIRLFAPNRFVKDWVKQHYFVEIQSLCRDLSGNDSLELSFEIGSLKHDRDRKSTASARNVAKDRQPDPDVSERRDQGNLNSEFVFDTFVEGKSNQIARAASMQISQNPGGAYNPLFVYGGVGLGKTHLMHAVGNMVLEHNPNARVVYLHSERFVTEMIKALQHNKMDEFKGRYRTVNALLIDDVQFFAGKDRSQEEFFHTFNALFECKQQIVLSSDRFPKEVSGVEERLRSRFGWGLTVAIEPPDFETRVAILHSKANKIGVELPDDVAFFVAKRIRSNIRDLEGALRRLVANSQFMGVPIGYDFARTALSDMLSAQDKQVTIENIQKTVADYYKIRVNDLLSSKRTRSIARPRQVAMALAKELTKHSLPEIGKEFGDRDHTTVLHATRRVVELRELDLQIDDDWKSLMRSLTS